MATRDGSRALTAILGIIAAVLAVAVTGVAVYLVTSSRNADPVPPAVTTVIEHTVSSPDPVPTVTQEVTVEVPAGTVPALGATCLESEARQFGTDANGLSLVCTYLGAGGGYQWVRHVAEDGQVHRVGEPCDPAVDRVSRDPSGLAIMCGGQTWVTGL